MRNAGRLLLPIGTTNYKKICDNYYYVDKTLMIKDILDEGTEISLFTRPRRFGKTLNMDMLRTFFEKQEEDTSRYFTDKKIEDIDDTMIASTITEHDLTVMADQLEDSMGQTFYMMNGFALMIYIIVIYLLAKTIIEKNAASISMLKILGYSDREAGNLYSLATGVVVAASLIIAIPLSDKAIKVIYYLMMKEYSGWLTYYIAPWIYPTMFVLGMLCYLVVYIIQSKKIRRIPLSQALKNVE